MTLSEIILQLSIWSVLAPLVAGLFFFRYLDEPSRIIFYVVVVATIPQLLTIEMLHMKGLNIVYNAYTLVEFVLIFLFVGNKLQTSITRRIGYSLVALFFLLAVWLITRYGLYHKFLNELVCAANIAYLTWILMFILEGLLNEERLMNTRLPVFWFIAGLLLYAACTVLLFSLTYYIKHSTNPFIHNLWQVQGVLNVALYILFAIGFIKNYQLARLKMAAK